MARIFLFNITRRELLFWDEPVANRPAWADVVETVPSSWNESQTVVCNVDVDLKQQLYILFGNKDQELKGNYNSQNMLCSFDIGSYIKKHWHVNDFTMLPAPKIKC
jgi:hypothetical protein